MHISPEFKYPCTLGRHCYAADGSPKLYFYSEQQDECRGKLVIGNFVSFGPSVTIFVGSEHFTEHVSTYPFPEIFDDVPKMPCIKSGGDVVIGSDVWIGGHVIILSGVTIGNGAVIGAGSVVTKDVEPYSIVAGNPIREIRKRFTESQRQQLLALQWWNWPDEKIDTQLPLIMSTQIEQFLNG